MELLEAAGLPPGVINLVTGDGVALSEVALTHPDLAGIHFTGSTRTFQYLWRTVGANIARYRTYPRLVGETGGKDFVVAHASADVDVLRTALLRGAFEYQGRSAPLPPVPSSPARCGSGCVTTSSPRSTRSPWATSPTSATSWAQSSTAAPTTASPACSTGCARIRRSTCSSAALPTTASATLCAPRCSSHRPEPTRCSPPSTSGRSSRLRLRRPRLRGGARLVDRGAPYGLTGAIIATDRAAILAATRQLRFAAGNFYINDKPTGSIVGQQPFGGSRASGTNDKAGSMGNLMRWTSPRAIKETFVPPTDHRYPHQD